MAKTSTGGRQATADQEEAQDNQAQGGITRCVSAHLPEDMYWQLKEIAASRRIDMKNVIAEAANALFRECGKEEIPVG